ncbi:MAG: L,D-transpeptidase family protein [Lachnospiraceae bacterium]|nr:L,D-transpeptidase family protein [Lachnospiraceae bacterium]
MIKTIFGIYTIFALATTSPVIAVGGAGEAGTAQSGQPVTVYQGPGPVIPDGSQTAAPETSFDTAQFVLPDEAGVLVVVEGTGGTACNVYAYEKSERGWELRVDTQGYLGKNGMSNNRTEGDKTTPVGLFQMNTPFGQSEALAGFPSNYIQVDNSYVWENDSNRLTRNQGKSGERVGSAGYAGYYDYVIDAGYNRNAVHKKGSALFLHCEGAYKESTSGCVAIPREEMITIMRLYGSYGDGRCYIAQAPANHFSMVYDAYGVNNGLCPDGSLN